MIYEDLAPEQASLASWALDHTLGILESPGNQTWNSRWLEVLRKADEVGFHPEVPKYGFGDATSYRLTSEVVQATIESGAVRHGAECFNFFFPQELDEEYLVVWEKLPDKPWTYLREEPLRQFLLDRANDGFSFPLNPVWPVRDHGWYEIFEVLQKKVESSINLSKLLPQESGLMAKIQDIHTAYPDGFVRKDSKTMAEETKTMAEISNVMKSGAKPSENKRMKEITRQILDLSAEERMDFIHHQSKKKHSVLKAASNLDLDEKLEHHI